MEGQSRLDGVHEHNTFAHSTGISNYGTPDGFFRALDTVYHFSRDPATGERYDPCPINPEGQRDTDGLGQTPAWVKSYFENPPYDNVEPWLDKAIEDKRRGVTAVLLLRVDCSTAWMHEKCFPYARPLWVRGRLHFKKPGPCMSCGKETTVDGRRVKVPAPECRNPKGHPSPFASVAMVYQPGLHFPGQAVMWEDASGWHISETVEVPV